MSGQWEVVGKSKKDKNSGKSKKLSKTEKKNFVDNAPKVEDLLPLAQVKTLYSALDGNKEPPKPPVEKAVKTKENEAKKAQKKPKEKKEPAVQKDNKPPKTIEAAVAMITASDLQNVLEVGQQRFAEAPLVWLKGLATWLNTKLPVDHGDNAFTAKSWEYPLCLLSPDVRNILKKAIKEVPEAAVQMFYDYCITSMANDMTKGSPVTGYKMLIQLVATQVPTVAVANLPKSADLRHSYQNRLAIGCSVMWALGLGGFKDISVGLQVWQEVMYPVCELRNYSSFVCDYLRHLLARHSTSKAVTPSHYVAILNTVFSTSSRQPPSNDLKNHLRTLRGIVFNVPPKNWVNKRFEALFSKLGPNSPPALNDEVCRFLTEGMIADPHICKLWLNKYSRQMPETAILLRHLNSEWSNVSSRQGSSALKKTLGIIKITNDSMILIKENYKFEGFKEVIALTDALVGKQVHGGRSFPWKTLSLLLVVVVAGAIALDVNTHPSYRDSKTGTFMKKVGALEYSEQAILHVRESSQKVYRWTEEHLPEYTAWVRGVLGPYAVIAADWLTTVAQHVATTAKQLLQYCLDKKPLVEQWVSTYAPGLMDSVSKWALQAWEYGLLAGTLALKYLSAGLVWLRENVFVGSLSPENLQRVTLEALNTTQTLAAQTMSWINSKVIAAGANSV